MLVHLSSNRLISTEQHGFLPKRSTTTQLWSYLNDWMDNFDQSIDTNVVYTDFSKAFDKVSHKKLVYILSTYGIKGSILTWIKNFLVNRQQTVHINTSSSRKVQITSGVPQGSVMGPLLFLLYIDDIKDLSTTGCQAYLFADDYKVYSTDKHALQQTLNNVSSFTKSRQLTLALPKCNHLLITNGNEHTNLKLDNDTLSPVWNVRDLGVQIKHNLKWDLHITNIKNKAVQRSYQIFRAFTTKNIWTLLKCYNVYVRPLLELNTIIWNPYMIKDINAIESVQEFFLKTICRRCSVPSDNYPHRLKMLDMKSLEYRRIEFDQIFMYKIKHKIVDLNFEDFFRDLDTPYSLRSNDSKVNRTKTNKLPKENFFVLRAAKVWNQLPKNIVNASSLNIFKNLLRSFNLSKFTINKYDS